MEFKNRLSNKLWCLFLIICLTKVCHGQLMCYVCENCSEVNSKTLLLQCNEDYFNTVGTTDSSVQTTTEGVTEEKEKSTTTTTEMPITTEEMTTETRTESTTGSTTEPTTESTTTAVSTTTEDDTTTEIITTSDPTTITEPLPPTPPTIGPPPTTTVIPTPPNLVSAKPIDNVEKLNSQPEAHDEHVGTDEVDAIAIENSTTKAYQPSAAFRIRQLRAINDVTYHCFKVQAFNVNGTIITNRGCSRVATMESVCGKWEKDHPMEKLNKCYPCSNTKCNGSTALNVSITAMIVAVVAVFMHRK